MNKWTRADLKQKAKATLKVNYWIAFVVALILVIVQGGATNDGNSEYRVNREHMGSSYDEYTIENFKMQMDDSIDDLKAELSKYTSMEFTTVAALIIAAIFIAMLVSILVRVLLFNQLVVGCQRFFVTSAIEPHRNMRHLGISFRDGNYWSVAKTMFIKDLYLFLWTLLLIIPGLIKMYSYRLVPYILADNPKLSPNEAITLSRQMMHGEKWNTFVLDLSFIGWYLLGALTCGVGILFVNPYTYSTRAQLYLVLRQKAIDTALCTPNQLNIAIEV